MLELNIEQQLKQWNLYKAYGEFNIRFEGVVAAYRKLLINLIKKYYGFNIDWEEEASGDVLPGHLQDRLLKILTHDDGAMAIIEKCRSCFMDITTEEVVNVLKANKIEPLLMMEFDIKFADILFKKGIELVTMRNILIHTHFEGGFFDWDPITILEGSKDKRVAKGFKEERFLFDVEFLEKMNQDLDVLFFYIYDLNNHILLPEVKVKFQKNDYNILAEISFKINN